MFLLIHWFFNTLSYFDELTDQSSLIDSNIYVCKIVNYLRNVCRCVFSMTTLSYSFERALAIFLPFKIIKIKSRVASVLIALIFLVSFISPLQYIYGYNLVEGHVDVNVSLVVCTIKPKLLEYFEKFSFFFNLFFVYLPLLFVILLNFSILIKLKNYKLEMTAELGKGLSTQFLKIMNQLYEENFNMKKINSIDPTLFNAMPMRTKYLESMPKNSLFTQNSANPSELNSVIKIKRSGPSIIINQKFSNTKTLVMISTCYIVLNIPNLINLFFVFNPFLEEKIEMKIKVQKDMSINNYLLFSEVTNLANYCINGLLFLIFGKAFRIHLKKIWHRFR